MESRTRNDVGAECQHDMRPSVQFPSVSGADSKLSHRISCATYMYEIFDVRLYATFDHLISTLSHSLLLY